MTPDPVDEKRIEPWKADFTALVHVLWGAGIHAGAGDDLAAEIWRSDWLENVRTVAADEARVSSLESQLALAREALEKIAAYNGQAPRAVKHRKLARACLDQLDASGRPPGIGDRDA